MYAIIYWESKGGQPKITLKGVESEEIQTFKKLKNADKYADEINYSDNCRVISLDGVKE